MIFGGFFFYCQTVVTNPLIFAEEKFILNRKILIKTKILNELLFSHRKDAAGKQKRTT